MSPTLKNKTILQVLPSLETGGVEQTTLDITEALVKEGAIPLIASNGGKLVKNIKELGGIHISLPLHSKNPLTIIQNYISLKKIIHKYKVDLIHARSRAPAWSAYWAAKSTLIPFVTTYHGIYNGKGALKKFYNSIMTRGNRVIANSLYTAKHAWSTHHVSPSLLRIIHRGVDFSLFDPSLFTAEEKKTFKNKLGFTDSSRPLFLLPGRLTRWKGQELFIEALSYLPRDSFYALIAGNPQGRNQYVENLKKIIKKYHLEENVYLWTEPIPMPFLLSLGDCIISASTDAEAFGRVMAEAGAMEKPVIASSHGGALEIVIPNKTGFLFPNKNAPALAETIKHFLTLSPKNQHLLGQEGRKHILCSFSKENMCDKTLSIYKELLYDSSPDPSLLVRSF